MDPAQQFALDIVLACAGFVGHFAIAVWLFNRLHAVAFPRKTIKILEKLLLFIAALVVGVFILRWLVTGHGLISPAGPQPIDRLLWLTYAVLCWTAAAAVVPAWLIPKLTERAPAALTSNDTQLIDVAARLGFRPVHGAEATFFAGLPGNQLLQIAVQRKTLQVANLPPELDGLTIAHLSDFHMTGHIGREFYDLVVDETNALRPDLIAITGDILEKEICLPWIPQTLGRLTAPHGKFFILGNHEMRLPNPGVLRAALVDAGITDLGGRCQTASVRGVDVIVAGTELPWFGTAPDVAAVPSTQYSVPGTKYSVPNASRQSAPANRGSSSASPQAAAFPFRLLLSHSPDQLPWARRRKFDLMLAGHNHGGQIRLPYLGALITPSHFGWRYAGGVYHEPPTLLHVSRGLGGVQPIRLNCPPELALLVLRRA